MEEKLQTLKLLLGIEDASRDALLEFCITDVENLILGELRTEFIPRQLESLVPAMAAEMYRAYGFGAADAPSDVTSVSEGDRSVSYKTRRPSTDILAAYYDRLKPYRNIRGRVPSEIIY